MTLSAGERAKAKGNMALELTTQMQRAILISLNQLTLVMNERINND
jgi:hypothetical protein